MSWARYRANVSPVTYATVPSAATVDAYAKVAPPSVDRKTSLVGPAPPSTRTTEPNPRGRPEIATYSAP
jgi:hypothetical protein